MTGDGTQQQAGARTDGALSGIRVLDLSTLLPGPLATLFLAEAGAEIIRIENPARGDEMRDYHPQRDGMAVNFHLLNRGKKSVVLDLKSSAGIEQLRTLIKDADIIVEQFRPGVMARLGLSYEAAKAIRPDIIYCSITGYGQSGPDALKAGHDLNYQASTGLLSLSYGSPEGPVVPPALIADIAGGTYPALVNILMAMHKRHVTGQGSYIDVAMAENLFPLQYWALGDGQVTGRYPGNGDAMVTGGTPRYRLYAAADGRLVAVAAIEQRFWTVFCEAIGLDAALRDYQSDPAASTAAIATLIAGKTAAQWAPILEAADCCCTIVRTLNEAVTDPHFQARGVFDARMAAGDGSSMAALPTPVAASLRASRSDALRAPLLGEHGAEYLSSPHVSVAP